MSEIRMGEFPSADSRITGHRFFTTMLNDKVLSDLLGLLTTLQPGSRLPSERELAESLGASRTAIRDRIARLVSMGVLQRRERSGTYFTGIRPENVSDVLILSMISQQMSVDSLVSVRWALERRAAIEASVNAGQSALQDMESAVERMERTDDGTELYFADNDFHKALFEASGSEGLIFFSRMLHAVLSGTLQHLTLERDRFTLRKLHRNILTVVAAGNEKKAGDAMDAHFEWLQELMLNEDK